MLSCGAISLLFLLLVCCWKKDLQRAVDVIDASADFIAHNKRVILVPNLHFLVTFVSAILWYGAFLCVISLNQIYPDPIIPQNRILVWENSVFFTALFMVFGFIWIANWIEYTSRFIVIVGATTFYFGSHRDAPELLSSA